MVGENLKEVFMEEKAWTLEIKPKRRWLDVDIKGVWRYRDLLRMYVRRDIVTVYKQTVLGPLWFVIQPVFTTIMYMFVFGGLANISTDGLPQPLFYFAGITLWTYFSSVFTSSSNVFTSNAGVFGKVYFPRLVVPLSSAISNLMKLSIQFTIFLVVFFYYWLTVDTVHPNLYILLLPFLLLLLALHAMSWGLIISSLTTKYRDLTQVVAFGMQLFMYATPIIYPLSVASPKMQHWLLLNPLTPIFEAFKYGFLGSGMLSWEGLAYSTVFMLVALFYSVIIFTRVERNFMDTV